MTDTTTKPANDAQLNRRIIRWERFRGIRAISSFVISTAGGAGLAPWAPGTAGTLVSIPLVYFTWSWSLGAKLLLWIVLTLLGTWAAAVFDEINQSGDNQNIVIDEVVGYGITAWTAGTHATSIIAAFVLFRLFDVIKIPPVRQLDRWSKTAGKQNPWWDGFGVMADDVLAGFQGLGIMLLLQYFGILPG